MTEQGSGYWLSPELRHFAVYVNLWLNFGTCMYTHYINKDIQVFWQSVAHHMPSHFTESGRNLNVLIQRRFFFLSIIHPPTWTTLRGNCFGYCMVRIYTYVVWPLKPRVLLCRTCLRPD